MKYFGNDSISGPIKRRAFAKAREWREKSEKKYVKNCSVCGGTGKISTDGRYGVKWCDCRNAVDSEFKAIFSYLKANIAPAYWSLTLDNIGAPEEAIEEVRPLLSPDNLRIMREEGLGLTFYGGNGTGKSSLANIVLKEALKVQDDNEPAFVCYYVTFAELVEMIFQSFDDKEVEREIELLIKQADFLVLDELGKEYSKIRDENDRKNNYALAELDKLMRYRDRELLVTIMTTNLSEREFRQTYGNSMKSLLSGKNKFILVEGEDYRPKQANLWDRIRGNQSQP